MLPSREEPPPKGSGAQGPSDAESCMVCLLDERAAQFGEVVYFRCDDDRITFAELRDRARSMAAGLVAAGVAPGDVVATMDYNSVSHLVAVHACMRVGAVWAPLSVSLRGADYAHSCQILRPRLLLTTAAIHAEHTFLNDPAGSVDVRLFPEESSGSSSAARVETGPAAGSPDHHWGPQDLSWVIQSGATTGGPKSIALPHAFAFAQAKRVIEAVDGRQDDVFFSVLQMSHAWVNFGVLAPCLVLGATAASTRWFSVSRWLSQVHATGATIVDPFLPMASALLTRHPSPDERTHRVRVAIGVYGAEHEYERRAAFEDRFGIPTINIYGLTETGGLVTYDRPGDRRPGAAGKVHPDYEVAIDDPAGWSTAAGAHGEILIRPRIPGTVALGYLGQAEKTLGTWRDLWIHTGDLGHFDEDGNLYLSGRQAFWVRRKGENVSVNEVEDSLMQVPGVAGAGVFGVPSPLGDQDIAAVLVRGPGSDVSADQVQENLRSQIAFYKIPRFFRFVDDIPRTVKGDVDRRRLTDDFDADLYVEGSNAAGSSPTPGLKKG